MAALLGLSVVTSSARNLFSAQDVQTLDQPSSSTPDPQQVIAEHLTLGRVLLQQGEYAAAQTAFRAVLELDATQPDALRLMTKAQQLLNAQQAKADKARSRLRRLAEDLAVKVAREKAASQAKEQIRAQQQVAHARAQQLKLLYNKGMTFYRQGRYQEAIDTLQGMALLDPTHPLVRDAQRTITRAETKQAEARAHVLARHATAPAAAAVPELEEQLAAKRIDIETSLKYARLAMKEKKYDRVIGFLQRVLAHDPQHRQAQQFLEEVQLAKLKDEETHLEQRVRHDEQVMINDVMRAQRLPSPKTIQFTAPVSTAATRATFEKLQQPISLDFTDVALSDVLEFVADAANISIIPSPQLDLKTRRVSLKVDQLPVELALKYLVKNQSLAYRVEQDAILIATGEEFSNEPLQTRLFFLHKGLGPFALQTAAIEPNPALATQSIKELIEKTVPQPNESKVLIDERSGALVVTNTAEHLQLVERLLSQLDITPTQVLIEARFIEVTMAELEQLGFEAVMNGDYALSKVPAPSGGRGPGHILAKGAGVKFPDQTRQDEGANITLQGVLSAFQFETVLHALEESKKSKTLSAPRVTTLNNQTAQIRVVDEFNYPTQYEVSLVQFDINGDGDFDDAGETQFVNVPKDIKTRDVGILLNVTPSVGKDLKTITLVLAPEVSQFSQFRDLGGGVTVPEFTTSQLTTSVVIENGQTVVLGGLMKDTTSHDTVKVPFFGDLPLVGNLFRQTEASSSRKNLLIFITARLLAPRGQTT